MSDKLIEVWYHKVMNEKSIRTPFVPEQQKFCSARKPPVALCPRNTWKNCIKSPIEMEPRNANGVPGLQIYSYLSG